MKHRHYVRKTRQLKYSAKKLNALLIEHRLDSSERIKTLIVRTKKLVKELAHIVSQSDLKKILGKAAILLGMSFNSQMYAQTFAAPEENPFGIMTIDYIQVPSLADLDGDGDIDLMVGGYYGLYYFENIGSATSPEFGPPLINPFSIDFPEDDLSVPSLADLDGDGDMDLMVGGYYGLQFFENIGSETSPEFGPIQANPFGLVLNDNDISIPRFVDLDDDGDMDLLLGGSFSEYGDMRYFENTGSSTSPEFAVPEENPFGLVPTYVFSSPSIVDLDEDGDMDLLVGEYYGNMQYFENTGSPTSPVFAAPEENPFGLVPTYYIALPAFADLDGDGDMDLLVAEYYGTMQYFENTEITSVVEQSDHFDLKLYPNPVPNTLNIESKEKINKIEIFNVLGKLCSTYQNPRENISLNHLSQGVYNVKLTNADGNYILRQIQKM